MIQKHKKLPSGRYKNQAFLRTLGRHCRRLRTQRGYSIDRLSKEGDQLSPAAVHRLETGTGDVHVSLLLRYAQVLELPIMKLFDFSFKNEEEGPPIVPYDEAKHPPKNSVPLYPITVAAGGFYTEKDAPEPEGWVIIDKKGSLKDYFAARVTGQSMEPTIPSGSICLFKSYTGGSRQGQIMLVRARGVIDPETGGTFVLKRYQRKMAVAESENRSGVTVHLVSDNPAFPPIVLKGLAEGDISTPAQFVEVL